MLYCRVSLRFYWTLACCVERAVWLRIFQYSVDDASATTLCDDGPASSPRRAPKLPSVRHQPDKEILANGGSQVGTGST